MADVEIQSLMENIVDQVSDSGVICDTNQDVEMLPAENENDGKRLETFKSTLDSEIKEIMEVDIPADDKENLRNIVRQLSRKELEDIILQKMVEVINSHSAVGSLRAKILSLYTLKDKLFLKSTALSKQATELSKAVKSMADNEARNPKTPKPQTPLRFYRSVGLQVSIDPKAHISGPSKINHWKNGSWAAPKSVKAQATSSTPGLIPLAANNMNSNPPSSPILKRPVNNYKPNVTVTAAEMAKQVQNQMSKPLVAKKVTTPLNVLRQQTNMNQMQQVPQMRNPAAQAASNALAAAGAASKFQNGNASVVDLTDDSKQANQGNVIVGQNGVQYRILNSPGMQLVQSPSGYQFVSQGPQSRPILLTQQSMQSMGVASQRSQFAKNNSPVQMVQLRNVAPKPANSVSRSIVIPQNNMMANLGSASRMPINTVMSRGGMSSVLNVSPKKFVLPPLPPTSMGSQIVNHGRRVKEIPSRPDLTLQEQNEGIVLSWTLVLCSTNAEVQSYQIYACQEPLSPVGSIGKAGQWKRVGDVKALPLPMACTLSQFSDENRYHFIVRGVDVYNRTGPFCEPVAIVLKKKH